MTKGSYNVYKPVGHNGYKSGYWKTFICSVLVLIVFALVLFLISLLLRNEIDELRQDVVRISENLPGNEQFYEDKFSTPAESNVHRQHEHPKLLAIKMSTTVKSNEISSTVISNVVKQHTTEHFREDISDDKITNLHHSSTHIPNIDQYTSNGFDEKNNSANIQSTTDVQGVQQYSTNSPVSEQDQIIFVDPRYSNDEQSTYSPTTEQQNNNYFVINEHSTHSPVVNQQSTDSPVVGQQNTHFPVVNQQSTDSPVVGQQSTYSPVVNQQSTDPRYSNDEQSTYSPTTEQQNNNSFVINEHSTHSSVVGQQNTYSPVVNQQNTDSPVVGQQNTYSPVVNQQSTDSPVVGQQNTYSPVVNQQSTDSRYSNDEQSTYSPTTEQQNNNSFVINEHSTHSPVVGQQNTYSPVVNQQSTDSPVVGQQNAYSPVVNQQSTDSSVVGQQNTYFPVVNQQNTDSPVVGQQNTYSPVVNQQNTDSPVVGQQNTHSPVVNQQSTDSPVVGQQNTYSPVVNQQNTDTPVVGQQNTYSPVVNQQNTDTPVVGQQNTYSPVVNQQNTDTPVVGQQNTYSPVVNQQSTDSPVVGQQNTHSPVVGQQNTYSPVVNQQSTDSPVVDQQTTHSPNSISTDKNITDEQTIPSYKAYPRCIEDSEKYCFTPECKEVSSKILSLIDFSNDACMNYYDYACGGMKQDYIRETNGFHEVYKRLSVKINGLSTSDDYLGKYKTYYDSCMNYTVFDGIKKFENIFSALNFKFYDKYSQYDGELEELFHKGLSNNFAAFFDIRVNAEHNSDSTYATMSLMPVFFDDLINDFVGNYKIYDENCYDDYKLCFTSHFLNDVEKALMLFVNSTLAMEILYDLDVLIINSANYIEKPERVRNLIDKNSQRVPLSYLQNNIHGINWIQIIDNLMSQNYTVNNDTIIYVYYFDFLKNFFNNIDDKRKFHNSFLALFAYKLYKDYVLDQMNTCGRKEYCVGLLTRMIPDLSALLYLETFDSEELESMHYNATDMLTNIYDVIKSNEDNTWTQFSHNNVPDDEPTLLTIVNKIPWVNNTFTYLKVAPLKDNDFISNTRYLEIVYRRKLYGILGNDVLKPDVLWSIIATPFDTKPTSYWNKNGAYIILPLAAFPQEKNFFNLPPYIQLSKLGYQMAKEIVNYKITPNGPHNNVMNNYKTPLNVISRDDNLKGESFNINVSTSARDLFSSVFGAHYAYKTFVNSKLENELSYLTLIWFNNMTVDQIFFLNLAQQYCSKKRIDEVTPYLLQNVVLQPLIQVNSIAFKNMKNVSECSAQSMVGVIDIEVDPTRVQRNTPDTT